MIEEFRRWFSDHQSRLKRDGIKFDLSKGSVGLSKNGISVVLTSDRFEATVELWETGESEFYFADWEAADRDPDYQVEITHHEFQTKVELYAALDELVNRMSPVLV